MKPHTDSSAFGVRCVQATLFPLTMATTLYAMMWSLEHIENGETAALILSLLAILVVVIAERLMPRNKEWSQNQGDLGGDLLSLGAIVVILQPLLRLVTPLAAIFILRTIGRPEGLDWFPSEWSLWIQLPLLAVGVEFGKYWMHRLGHQHPWWWRFHAVHHSPRRVYWLNGFLIHPFNFLYAHAAGVFVLILIGAGVEVLLLHSVFEAVGAVFQHANVKLRHGWLSYLFSTNELHSWHHSLEIKQANTNYGSVLIVWDLVFGSYFRPEDRTQLPQALGIKDPVAYPVGRFGRQIAAPFCWKRCTEPPSP